MGKRQRKGIVASLMLAPGILGPKLEEAETERLVLGLVMLKCLNDQFGAESEGKNEGPRSLVLPTSASWRRLDWAVGKPTLGRIVDLAQTSLERANPCLRGTFPKDYARPEVDPTSLGALVARIGGAVHHPEGWSPAPSIDEAAIRRSQLLLDLARERHEAKRLIDLLHFTPRPFTRFL